MSATRPPRQQAAPTRPATRGSSGRVIVSLLFIIFIGAVAYLLASWSPSGEITSVYGKRSGTSAGISVNGTAVLAEMFEQRGSRVSSWRRLSPKLNRADTIVWVPDSFEPPSDEVCEWFEQWLSDGYGRTIIYIGRDYEGEVEYWKRMQAEAPPEQANEVSRRLASARSKFDDERITLANRTECNWFSVRRDVPRREVKQLVGSWSDSLDANKANLTIGEAYLPPNRSNYSEQEREVLLGTTRETWLSHQTDPLVMRLQRSDEWITGQIIVVTNGSFLLNLPLVNHEHRKLAAMLIGECGSPDRVVFLETGAWGASIVDEDEDMRPPGALDMMLIWPLSAVVTHVVAFGIILCLACFPIFGRPRNLPEESRADFTHHIEALGKLLEKTKDTRYAREQLEHYQQRVRRDSGVTHADSPKPLRLPTEPKQEPTDTPNSN